MVLTGKVTGIVRLYGAIESADDRLAVNQSSLHVPSRLSVLFTVHSFLLTSNIAQSQSLLPARIPRLWAL